MANTIAIDLQGYINGLEDASTQWYELPGLLGLGLFGSFVATVTAAYLLLYLFGVFYQKKENDRWHIPNTRFLFEVGRGLGIHYRTILGIATPRGYFNHSDSKYQHIPEGKAMEAIVEAKARMLEQGWLLSAYKKRSRDCEDYAYKLKSEVTDLLADYVTEGSGVPVGLTGYTRKDGVKHVVCHIDTPDGRKYFEAFVERSGWKELTAKEIDSIDMVIV